MVSVYEACEGPVFAGGPADNGERPFFGAAGFPAAGFGAEPLLSAAFSFLNSAWALRMSAMKVSFVCRLG